MHPRPSRRWCHRHRCPTLRPPRLPPLPLPRARRRWLMMRSAQQAERTAAPAQRMPGRTGGQRASAAPSQLPPLPQPAAPAAPGLAEPPGAESAHLLPPPPAAPERFPAAPALFPAATEPAPPSAATAAAHTRAPPRSAPHLLLRLGAPDRLQGRRKMQSALPHCTAVCCAGLCCAVLCCAGLGWAAGLCVYPAKHADSPERQQLAAPSMHDSALPPACPPHRGTQWPRSSPVSLSATSCSANVRSVKPSHCVRQMPASSTSRACRVLASRPRASPSTTPPRCCACGTRCACCAAGCGVAAATAASAPAAGVEGGAERLRGLLACKMLGRGRRWVRWH